MKEISSAKQVLLKIIAKKQCQLDDPSACPNEICKCRLLAEIQALVATVVPQGFRNFTIKSFDGQDSNQQSLLSPDVAMRAKTQVAAYCWKNLSLDQIRNMGAKELVQNSSIAERVSRGSNIVIHGDPKRVVSSNSHGENRYEEKPVGRTFVASIFTKEAIGLRLVRGFSGLTYDWVEYATLLSRLSDGEASDHANCDWLVIDDITKTPLSASDKQKAYIQSMLDPFLFSRLEDKLPTVFVFKFDVTNERKRIEETFGVAMSKMLGSKNTFLVPLS